jgi:hypothetical protein
MEYKYLFFSQENIQYNVETVHSYSTSEVQSLQMGSPLIMRNEWNTELTHGECIHLQQS